MEEILASIRRIIADDEASKTVARAPEPPRPEPPPPPPPAPPISAPRPTCEPEPSSEEPAPVAVEEPADGPRPMAEQAFRHSRSDASQWQQKCQHRCLQPSAVASPSPAASQFRTIHASPDVGFDDFRR